MRLVGDIGGTNARLALSRDGRVVPQSARAFANADWPHLYDIIDAYLAEMNTRPLFVRAGAVPLRLCAARSA